MLKHYVGYFLVFVLVGTSAQAAPSLTERYLQQLASTHPEVVATIRTKAPLFLRILKWKKEVPTGMKVLKCGGLFATIFLSIVLFAVLHDQYTVRISKEYFSEGFHKHNMKSFAPGLYDWLSKKNSPSLWGTAWGVIAGGVFAAMFAPILGAAAFVGPLPLIDMKDIAKPLGVALGMALAGSLVGAVFPARIIDEELYKGSLRIDSPEVTGRVLDRYLCAQKAHTGIYAGGFLGVATALVWVYAHRIMRLVRYKKEGKIARRLLRQIEPTPENEKALRWMHCLAKE